MVFLALELFGSEIKKTNKKNPNKQELVSSVFLGRST